MPCQGGCRRRMNQLQDEGNPDAHDSNDNVLALAHLMDNVYDDYDDDGGDGYNDDGCYF